MFKRGQKVTYTYAGGKIVPGRIVRYQDMDNVPGRPDLRGLTRWWLVELTDEAGKHRGSCHQNQLRALEA